MYLKSHEGSLRLKAHDASTCALSRLFLGPLRSEVWAWGGLGVRGLPKTLNLEHEALLKGLGCRIRAGQMCVSQDLLLVNRE